ncbi:MAG TPA: hypothetical protein VM165_01280 [Planctomycetaceae bacterium]|nr:hypothetical protein [Planctomycetaceae bacterium]
MLNNLVAGLWSRLSRNGVLVVALCALLTATAPARADANEPPVILDYSFEWLGGEFWVVYGFVDDEDPDTCRVDFGGDLIGYSCDVSSNGEFSLLLELPPGMGGSVPAIALDAGELMSTAAYDWLANY